MNDSSTMAWILTSNTTFTTTTPFLVLNNTTTNAPHYDSVLDYDIYNAGQIINNVYLWVIFAFGFPGNVFAFVTILRMKPRNRASFYVAALAFVDNTCLLCKIIYITLTRYDAAMGDAGCRFLEYMGVFTGQMANWLLVAMTLDRCLEITMPLRSRKFGNRYQLVLTATIATTLLVLNVPYVITIAYLTDSSGLTTCMTDPRLIPVAQIMEWVDVAVYAVVPAALLVVMSALILRALKKSSEIMRHMSHQRELVLKRERAKWGVTVMIVVTCVVFTILVTPRPLLSAVLSQWHPTPSTREALNIEFTGQVFYVLSDSSHAVNFYLYFLSNARFRRHFVRLVKELLLQFCCCCCCCCGRPGERLQIWARRFRNRTVSGSMFSAWSNGSNRMETCDEGSRVRTISQTVESRVSQSVELHRVTLRRS